LGKKKNDLNAITCHLGNGCSITAIRNGQSIDTSMGFTPLEGLVMGTRPGDFDPAIIFYLESKGYDQNCLNNMFNKQSGLLGISGISNDIRNLFKAVQEGSKQARLAIDVFCYRIKKYIGAYTAVLGSLDAIVFAGGIGENSAKIRSLACQGLTHIGIELNEAQNENTVNKQGCISNSNSPVKVLVIPTNEEIVIASETLALA
jgi:acetate kinase